MPVQGSLSIERMLFHQLNWPAEGKEEASSWQGGSNRSVNLHFFQGVRRRHADPSCRYLWAGVSSCYKIKFARRLKIAHYPAVPLRFRLVGREEILRLRFSLIALV